MNFEDRLLTHLQQYAADRPAAAPATTSRRTTRRPVRRLAVGVAAAAVLGCVGAAGVPALMGGGGGAPAYAVDRRSDGTLVVHINEFRDPDGLARRLTQLGVPAHATYLPEGQSCAPHRYRWAPGGSARVKDSNVILADPVPQNTPPAVEFMLDGHHGAYIVIYPGRLRRGESLVLVSHQFPYPDRTPWPDVVSISQLYQHAGSDGGYGAPADGPRVGMLVKQPDGVLMLGIDIATGPVGACHPAPSSTAPSGQPSPSASGSQVQPQPVPTLKVGQDGTG